MKRIPIKVDRRDISFRITIPRRVIQYKRWDNVEYLLLEESGPDAIKLRRFIDVGALEPEDQRSIPGFD